jgi:Tol biopolymer transport system component
VVSSTRLETNPALSSDGRRLAFSSDQSGFSEIWTSDPDGNGATRLTSTNSANTGSPDWSPDGKQIVFDSRIERRPHLYLVPAVGGRPRKLMDASGVVPHWSPDGKWIYYSSDASGQMEIWRVYPTGSSPERITKKGGFGGILSTNSKFLYFTADNAPTGSLWEMELATRDARIVADSVLNRGYAVLADALYYIQGHPETDDHSLYRYDLKTRKAKVLFQLQHRIERGISLSPDGQSLYYPGIDRENHELRLVNHFWK